MINDELKDMVICLRANKLSLNINKTHYMLFSNKNVAQPNITIEIDKQPITCVTKTKFLGVIIDSKLSWKEHISYVCGKVAKGIGIISKVRKYVNKSTLLELYYSFSYPYLTYCNHVWGLSCKSYMDAMVMLQKFKFKFKLFIGITSKVTSFTNVQETKNMKHEIGVHKGVMKQYIVSHTHTLTHTRHTCTLTTYCSYLLHFKYTQVLTYYLILNTL